MDAKLKDFIYQNKSLFWYIPESSLDSISQELLLESILNYCTLDEIKKFFEIFGISNAANVFRNLKGREKLNYKPEVYNYFNLVFDRYVPRNS